MSNVKEKKYDKTLIIVIVVEVVATFRAACSFAPLQRHYLLLPLGPVLTSRSNLFIKSVHRICRK